MLGGEVELVKHIILALLVLAVLLVEQPKRTDAHHFDHGHGGYLHLPEYELPGKIANGQPINIWVAFGSSLWQTQLVIAINEWNDGLLSTTGFNVFSYAQGDVSVNAGTDVNQCKYLPNTNPPQPAHACVFPNTWIPSTPTATIYMYETAIGTDPVHRRSDLLHEMGHVLFNAGEHYPGGGCVSIMDHCLATEVTSHDVDDFTDAFRLMEAPDAAYAQLLSSSMLRNYFEGTYYNASGEGHTIHGEKQYVVDVSTSGATGTYSFFTTTGREINNVDDGVPNDFDTGLPANNTDWCLKVRGENSAISSSAETYRWSPRSRAYCIANSSNGVYVLSNRNDYAAFRVWNFSGAQINNVAIFVHGGTSTRVCDLGSIPNGQSSTACFSYGLGSAAGRLDLWYNWALKDEIWYDAR
jgi:hypothetical protein